MLSVVALVNPYKGIVVPVAPQKTSIEVFLLRFFRFIFYSLQFLCCKNQLESLNLRVLNLINMEIRPIARIRTEFGSSAKPCVMGSSAKPCVMICD